MKLLVRVVVLAAVSVGGACTNTPAPPAAAAPESAPEKPAAPVSDSVSRADALLAEMRHREAEVAKIEREQPKVPAVSLEQWQRAQPTAPATSSSSPATSVPSPVAPSAQANITAAPARDEFYWKDRMRALQSRLDSDTLAVAAARAQVDDLSRYVNPDGSMSRTVADNMFKARENVTRLIATVASDEREINNLHEEARRAGVPPGWLRP